MNHSNRRRLETTVIIALLAVAAILTGAITVKIRDLSITTTHRHTSHRQTVAFNEHGDVELTLHRQGLHNRTILVTSPEAAREIAEAILDTLESHADEHETQDRTQPQAPSAADHGADT